MSLPLSAFGVTCISWPRPLPHISLADASVIKSLSLTLTLLFPSFTYKDPCDCTGSSGIIQDNRLISRTSDSIRFIPSTAIILPLHTTYLHILVIKTCTSLGATILAALAGLCNHDRPCDSSLLTSASWVRADAWHWWNNLRLW